MGGAAVVLEVMAVLVLEAAAPPPPRPPVPLRRQHADLWVLRAWGSGLRRWTTLAAFGRRSSGKASNPARATAVAPAGVCCPSFRAPSSRGAEAPASSGAARVPNEATAAAAAAAAPAWSAAAVPSALLGGSQQQMQELRHHLKATAVTTRALQAAVAVVSARLNPLPRHHHHCQARLSLPRPRCRCHLRKETSPRWSGEKPKRNRRRQQRLRGAKPGVSTRRSWRPCGPELLNWKRKKKSAKRCRSSWLNCRLFCCASLSLDAVRAVLCFVSPSYALLVAQCAVFFF